MLMRGMTIALVAFASLGLVACVADEEPVGSVRAATGEPVIHTSTWNGGGAQADLSSPTGFGFIDVFETRGTEGHTAELWFHRDGFDPDSEVCETETLCFFDPFLEEEVCEEHTRCWYTRHFFEFGHFYLEPGDFSVGGRAAELVTDLSTLEDFTYERCVQDWDAMTFECTNEPPSGTIDIRWAADGARSYFRNGVTHRTMGERSWRTSGRRWSVSANTSGEFLGTVLDDRWGRAEINRTNGVSVTKNVVRTDPPTLP